MVLSKVTVGRFLGVALLLVLYCSLAHASGGACPASSPLAGNNSCFYISSQGSDSNTGADESHTWLHSPGMINCSANCASEQTALGGGNNNGGQSHPGVGFIFRGGDTWHFSNPSPSDGMPYTGGEMYSLWGSNSNCIYEGTQTGCFYWGVDTTWYNSSVCGGSFCRPIFNGDNPTSTSIVSSCPYPTRTINPFDRTNANNVLFQMANDTQAGVYLDSIEFTGLCSNDTTNSGGNAQNDTFLIDGSDTGTNPNFVVNVYMHGWTVTTAETTAGNSMPNCTVIGGGSLRVMDHVVIDGEDSNGRVCNGFQWPHLLHVRYSLLRYLVNINTNDYHDVHDNIIEHFAGGIPTTHGNFWENNVDDQTSGTANVWYNNIMRHNDPTFSSQGYVGLWFCPNKTPEYWFNNIQYDFVINPGAVMWSVVGPPTYGNCDNSGKQYEFNNTIVDSQVDCAGSNDNTGGQYLYSYNNHMINAGFRGTTCNGGPNSATNVTMSDATATTQGYTTGSGGFSAANNCANDPTTPCSPTAAKNGTVGAGSNLQNYCTALAGFTGDPSISTDAANACKYSTTNACAYNTSTHTMVCPAQTAVARPLSGVWDSGAYEFNTQDPPPNPPTGLAAVVN